MIRPCCRNELLRVTCTQPINAALINLVVDTASQVIPCAPPTPGSVHVPPLHKFVNDFARRMRVSSSTLITAICYLSRLQRKLPSTARGLACTLHRIVLASMLVATKYLYDAPVKNRVWAAHSAVFSLAEVNLMERQLLFLLDFKVGACKEEMEEIILRLRLPDQLDKGCNICNKTAIPDICPTVREEGVLSCVPVPSPILPLLAQQLETQPLPSRLPLAVACRDQEHRTVLLRRPSAGSILDIPSEKHVAPKRGCKTIDTPSGVPVMNIPRSTAPASLAVAAAAAAVAASATVVTAALDVSSTCYAQTVF
ncbi:uncharacterized protein SPPG_00531 [Spizellomyces punctatus DAOM BR117]|uniref:Cyclin N-terminal domain-containing protein n=1 Tax=Spizellomyces punctatus (strain DAOM BR117) TaxID=645134 RepID=A0A0L0HUM7_SPIPD|nr:uncharacterized protein SPPG_00531 [Spizellomyces punctatus DAOM BR117]KND04828.1 hypothetical protein SPPG_00531 [Spizellomyces punctatus DAOM BR117]|eukprot:XP_016612867.1 hypothetical protein SPPG_00531 [Spizellomyces punctatus DAOM BR117]